MTFLVIANFKSNLTQAEVSSWLKAIKPQPGMVVAPSFLHLPLFSNLASKISLCAQDVSPFPKGSYTGAINAEQLKELGVTYCLVGHSERRRYFHESSSEVANKVKELLNVGITPLVCMDEADVTAQFAALDSEYLDRCIFCYEPNDGIGGTQTATQGQITSVRKKIEEFIPGCKFIYGGSINSDNVTALLELNLFGVLVGSSSLDPSHYLQLFEACHGA